MDGDYLKLYEAMNDRITDLAKSYRVLNEHHQNIEVKIVRLETRIETVVSIVKWFISPIALISLVLQILRICGVI